MTKLYCLITLKKSKVRRLTMICGSDSFLIFIYSIYIVMVVVIFESQDGPNRIIAYLADKRLHKCLSAVYLAGCL